MAFVSAAVSHGRWRDLGCEAGSLCCPVLVTGLGVGREGDGVPTEAPSVDQARLIFSNRVMLSRVELKRERK